jgi:hypothetical protein
MTSTPQGFVFTLENGNARDAREGDFSPLVTFPGYSGTQHNLSKEGSTNE